METIAVALGSRSYDILIEDGLVDRAGEILQHCASTGRLIVVTDHNVWQAQGARLATGLGGAEPILIAPGEASKSWTGLAGLIDALLDRQISRNDHIIAFGGGVVGDLAGFAASIVKRGCNIIQIPTSLLAQVDSSVGGKTGIDVPAGKNLVGAFHQPRCVLLDPSMLETLDARQLRAGYAEIVKYALIEDPKFFAWLELNGKSVIERERDALEHAIRTSVDGKRRIVEEDEMETRGRRALLNLGHTFAHALEAASGYDGTLLHGEAVAIGLVCAFRLSARLGFCDRADADRVEEHLRGVGLPVRLRADPAILAGHIRHDKKRSRGRIAFILGRGIGRAFVHADIGPDEVEDLLESAM